MVNDTEEVEHEVAVVVDVVEAVSVADALALDVNVDVTD